MATKRTQRRQKRTTRSSSRISSRMVGENTVQTRTAGKRSDGLSVSLSTRTSNGGTTMSLSLSGQEHELTGRQARTLQLILNKHYELVDQSN